MTSSYRYRPSIEALSSTSSRATVPIEHDRSNLLKNEKKRDTAWYKSMAAGVGSGLIKIPEGFASLAAELTDVFGMTSDGAAEVEEFFDKLNPFDETAEKRLAGKITETLTSLIGFGGIGIKGVNKLMKAPKPKYLVDQMAKKALAANKGGRYANLKVLGMRAKNSPFLRISAGIGIGSTLSPDSDQLAFFGDTQEEESASKDAQRKIQNRLIFGAESLAASMLIGGIFKGVSNLRKANKGEAAGKDFADYWAQKANALTSKAGKTKSGFRIGREELIQAGRVVESNAERIGGLVEKSLEKIYPSSIFSPISQLYSTAQRVEKRHFLGLINEAITGKNLLNPHVSIFTPKRLNFKKFIEAARAKGMKEEDITILIKQLRATRGVLDSPIKKMLAQKGAPKEFTPEDLAKHAKWEKSKKAYTKDLNVAVKNWQKNITITGPAGQQIKVKPAQIGTRAEQIPEHILKLRSKIFKLSDDLEQVKLAKEGYAISIPAVRRTFEEAIGSFLPAVFKASQALKVKSPIAKYLLRYEPAKEEFNRAVKYLRDTLGGGKGGMTEQEAVKHVERMLKEGRIPHDITQELGKLGKVRVAPLEAVLPRVTAKTLRTGGYKPGKIDRPEALRYDQPLEIVLGRVDDPVLNITHAVVGATEKRLKANVANALFEVGKSQGMISTRPSGKIIGKTKGVFQVEPSGRRTEIFKNRAGDLPNKFSWGPILEDGTRGKYYVMKEFKESILDPIHNMGVFSDIANSRSYTALILAPKQISQLMKTVASVVTHSRNFISAGAFAVANGNLGLTKNPFTQSGRYLDSFKEAFTTKGRASSAYRDYLKRGIVNTNVRLGDIRALTSDVMRLRTLGGISAKGETVFGRIVSPFTVTGKKAYKFAERAYQAEDDFWKIINYHGEQDKIRYWNKSLKGKAKLSEEQIKNEAAEIVKNTVPNYDFVPQMVKHLRKLPIGNFVSFPAEMVRTSSNILERGIKEISRGKILGNEALKQVGKNRLVGFGTAVAGIPISVQTAAKTMYNVSEEEMMALKRFVPEWSKDSVLIPVREDGVLKYMDLSYSLAYDVVARPAMTLVNAVANGIEDEEPLMKSLADGMFTSVSDFFQPFVDEAIFTKALADVFPIFGRGGRTRDGKSVWYPGDPFGEKAAKAFVHVAYEPFMPGSTKQLKRILFYGEGGDPDKHGRKYELSDELPGLAGFRLINPDPDKSLLYKVSNFNAEINNYQKAWYNDVNKGGIISSDEFYEQWLGTQRGRFNSMREMYKDIRAANTLGISDEAYFKQTERISSKDLRNAVQDGHFRAYEPSDKTLESIEDKAARDGWMNEYLEGRRKMLQKIGETDFMPLMGHNPFDWFEDNKPAPRINKMTSDKKLKDIATPVSELGYIPLDRTTKPTTTKTTERTTVPYDNKRFTRNMALPKSSPSENKKTATLAKMDSLGLSLFAKGGEVKKKSVLFGGVEIDAPGKKSIDDISDVASIMSIEKDVSDISSTVPPLPKVQEEELPTIEKKEEPTIDKIAELPTIEKKEEPITKEEKTITDSVKQTFVPTPVKLILTQLNPLKGDKPDTFNAEHVGKNVVDTATLVANVAESKGRKWVHYEDYGVTKRGLSLAALVGEKYSPKTNPKYITKNNPKGKVPYTKEKLKEMTDHVAEIYPINPIGAARYLHDLKTDPKIETALAKGGFSILYDKKGNRSVKDQFNFNSVNEGAKDFYRLMRSAFSKSKHIALHEGEGPWSIFPLGPRENKEVKIAAK